MITTYIPYAGKDDELNLGATYNEMMEACPTEWACFLDHDAMWLTKDWYADLTEAAHYAGKSGIGLLSCVTNRIGTGVQRIKGHQDTHDIMRMRRVAQEVRQSFGGDLERAVDTNVTNLSGVVILISKKAWRDMGGFADGFLGVDYDACARMRRAGYLVGLMRHVVVYHWWRADGDLTHVHKANELHTNPHL